ncbi:conserved hypothetical protein [Candidatus Sulfopaludibacter sp. SbA3]|nr:conserved hypothetical protein [Candidatus Sulfopaludibacter sp. SbA3]
MAQAGAMPPPAAPRKTSPLVWILVVVLGLFVLGFVGIVGTWFFVAHKLHQAGIDSDLARRNPAAVVARMAAMANKDVDIVSEDDRTGTLTLRDKRTGKTVTMSFDQAKNGISFSAQGDDGKTATLEFGSGKLPSWIPSYPGSTPQVTIAATGDGNDGKGEGGNFTYTTSDSASRVLTFYQDKAKDMGMKVNLTSTAADAGMVMATDDASNRTLTAIVGTSDGKTTVNVTYGSKR